MTYSEFIQSIINTSGQWTVSDGEYYEIHHILPKALGGLPKRASKRSRHRNIIWLSGRNHFIAHKLLAEENPKNLKITQAFWRMCHTKNCDYEITPEEYECARKLHASNMRTKFLSSENPSRGKPNKYCLGKHWQLSNEAKQRHSVANKKQIMCIETGKIYESINAAAEEFKISRTNFSSCLHGNHKAVKGYHWQFVQKDTE